MEETKIELQLIKLSEVQSQEVSCGTGTDNLRQ